MILKLKSMEKTHYIEYYATECGKLSEYSYNTNYFKITFIAHYLFSFFLPQE